MSLLINNRILFLFSLFFLLVTACNNDNDEVVVPEETLMERKVNLLAGTDGKAWTLEKATLKGFNIKGFLPNCEQDNLYVFYPHGEGEYQAGEKKCDENTAEVKDTGYWDLSEDIETLTLTVGMFSNDSKVLEISANQLKLEMTYDGQTVIASFVPAE